VNGAVYLNGALISSSGTISFTNATLHVSTVNGIAVSAGCVNGTDSTIAIDSSTSVSGLFHA
jgi:hypothetical protein